MSRGRKPQPVPETVKSTIVDDLRSLKQMKDIAQDRNVSLYYIRKIKNALLSGEITAWAGELFLF